MTKPMDFQEQTVIQHETSYRVDPSYPKGTHAGTGVLGAGRVVWTQKRDNHPREGSEAKAFADGIGVISVAVESLRQ